MPKTPGVIITPGEMCYPYKLEPGAAPLNRPYLVFHRNSFDGALIDTGTAIGAETLIDNGLVFAGDGLGWTTIDAGFTGGADIGINFCWHLFEPFLS